MDVKSCETCVDGPAADLKQSLCGTCGDDKHNWSAKSQDKSCNNCVSGGPNTGVSLCCVGCKDRKNWRLMPHSFKPGGFVRNDAASLPKDAVKEPSALNDQHGGDHYKKFGDYQPWQVVAKWLTPEELKGYMKGTVIAYLAREADKGGRLDIEKAMHTMQIYLELSK